MSSSRNWWSRDVQEKNTRSLVNSIASAIGLKSKKRPSLIIQDPHIASAPTFTTQSCSRVDSAGPITPVDYQRDEGRSLLYDPFAGRPLIIPPEPQSPSKKTPLSVDTSLVRRTSFSSLSTNDASTLSPTLCPTEYRKVFNKRSTDNLQISRSTGSTDPLIRYTSLSSSLSPKRPGSSSAGGQIRTRPKLRARGMTVGGGTQVAGFFPDEQPASKKLSRKSSTSTFSPAISSPEHASPRAVIRQASQSRLIAPPCAPPMHSLPATPHSLMKVPSPFQGPDRFLRTESISSSCISSSSTEILPALSSPLREKRFSERSVFSQDHGPEIPLSPAKKEFKTAPSSPRVLRKTLSQQSFTGKPNVHSSTLPKLPSDNVTDKASRKQRPSHPPIPDPVGQPSSANSTTFPSSVATERRTSGNSSLGGKRLLSHSSPTRPSTPRYTPTSPTMEDDSQSVFSLRSDRSSHLVSFKPWASPTASPQSLLWEEAGSPVPSSPTRSTSEYMPQHILSAAELAKLEASVENSSDRFTRSRAFSLLSASTIGSDKGDLRCTPTGLSPPPTARPSKRGSTTGKSYTVKTPPFYSPVSSRARSPPRPSPLLNNENRENDSKSTTTYRSSSSELPTLSSTSLPPPPRSRQRPQPISHPKPSNTRLSNSSSVAKVSRSKSTVEKNMQRQSIMRKPSFLEIDDDTDQDVDSFSGEAMTESFLDLARESFETNHR